MFYAGCASPSYRRAQDQDRLLSIRVNEAIATTLPDGAVQGRAYRGVVVLLGEVSTVEGRGSAETAAKTVRGVARVNNMILVEMEGDSSKAAGSAPVTGVPVIAARAEMVPAP